MKQVVNVGVGADMMMPLMMSCAEVAEVCASVGSSKRHGHALRDARVMLLNLYGGDELKAMLPEKAPGRYLSENAESIFDGILKADPTLGQVLGTGFTIDRDTQGRVSEIWLDKMHATNLVSKYSDKLRMALIRRIGELEAALAEKTLPVPIVATPAPVERDARMANLGLGMAALAIAASTFGYDEHRKLALTHEVFEKNGAPTYVLPAPTSSRYANSKSHSPTHQLKTRGIGVGAKTLYKMCVMAGIVEQKWRESRTKVDGKLLPVRREYWVFTDAGLKYGRNRDNDFVGGDESATRFYDDKFDELLTLLRPHYRKLRDAGYKPLWPSHENAARAQAYLAQLVENERQRDEFDSREAEERRDDLR